MSMKSTIIWRLIMAILVAIATLAVDYWAMNRSVTLGSEKLQLQMLEYVRQRIKGPQTYYATDSVLMVDVHYDKVMVTERKQAPDGTWMEMGEVPVTDREKLLRLLRCLEARNYDYRYIMLDVRLEASTRQPEDTALWKMIANMPRLVIARPMNSEQASPLLKEKSGVAQYNTTLWETDFLKYPLYLGSIPSMAMKMYEDTTGREIRQWGPIWVDGCLARSSMILTWDFVDCSQRFYLGDLLADLEGGGDDSWDGCPKGKYILIGDFEDDIHSTFFGEMPGTLLIYNAYLSLLQHRHLLSPILLALLFCLFWALAWLTLSRNRLFSWLCSFWGYAGFLTIFCFITYLVFNEVYDILMTTLIFYALKTGVEWYDRRHQLFDFFKRIIKRNQQ